MFCKSCGQNLIEGNRFCENCGLPIEGGREPFLEEVSQPKIYWNNPEIADQGPIHQVSSGVMMGQDGIMRWAYEMNMWKNPTLVMYIWKVLLFCALLPALLMFFLSLEEGFLTALLIFMKVAVLIAMIVTGLMLVAYPIVALINGGKYCVIFEMDDIGVKHIQMLKQFKKSQILSMIVVLAGALTGNIQTTGAGILAGSKQSLYTCFSKVKTVEVNKKRQVIYVNEKLTRNQVYAEPADFNFVMEYITSHSKKARVKI